MSRVKRTRGYLLAEPDLGAGHRPHIPHIALLAAQGPGLAKICRVNVETDVTAALTEILTRLGDDTFDTLLSWLCFRLLSSALSSTTLLFGRLRVSPDMLSTCPQDILCFELALEIRD